MPLLDMEVYGALGLPPSFASVSRDEYPVDTVFGPHEAEAVLTGLAEALAFLASRRIIHGDVYAHNTLVSRPDATDMPALLTDFGAAWFATEANAAAAERVEVRAFGCLVEELATMIRAGDEAEKDGGAATTAAAALRTRLVRLAERCMNESDVMARPSFAEVLLCLRQR